MNLTPISYNGGTIWVDKNITPGCIFHIDGRIEKCIRLEQNRVYTEDNQFYHLFTVRGMEILSEQLCMKVVAQSPDQSIPNIPYVEIEEDVEKLAWEWVKPPQPEYKELTEAERMIGGIISKHCKLKIGSTEWLAVCAAMEEYRSLLSKEVQQSDAVEFYDWVRIWKKEEYRKLENMFNAEAKERFKYLANITITELYKLFKDGK